MDRKKEFENILDECLERIIHGEGIEACLARYPGYAAELEPLLKTALKTRSATAIKPRPEFRQRAGIEFQAAIREAQPSKVRGAFQWQARWVMVVAIIIVVLIAGSGTVVVASNSLPDSPLYSIKLATEAVQLALTPSDLGKAELYAKFADRRVEEIIKMSEKGKLDQVEKVTDRLDSQLIAMANLTSAGEKTAGTMDSMALQAPVAATPAPTTATLAPTVTMPAPTPTPAPTVTAPPSTEEATAPVTVAAPALGGGKRNVKSGDQQDDKQEKLKLTLIEKLADNIRALQDALEKAPDSLKPALQRAIEVAQRGYEQALQNLE